VKVVKIHKILLQDAIRFLISALRFAANRSENVEILFQPITASDPVGRE